MLVRVNQAREGGERNADRVARRIACAEPSAKPMSAQTPAVATPAHAAARQTGRWPIAIIAAPMARPQAMTMANAGAEGEAKRGRDGEDAKRQAARRFERDARRRDGGR